MLTSVKNSLELSATINATTLALIDAGVPLLGLVCATSLAIIDTTPPAEGTLKSKTEYSYYNQRLPFLQRNEKLASQESTSDDPKTLKIKAKFNNLPQKTLSKCIPFTDSSLPSSKLLVINPSNEDLQHADSWHTVAYEFKEGVPSRLLLVDSKGKFSKQELYKVLEVAATASQNVYVDMALAVGEKLEKEFIWRS